MKLNEQIKYLRKSRGLTQRQVAKMSAISYDLYTKFESGARNISYVKMECVMDTLSGSICVVPYRFKESSDREVEFKVNDYGPNGVTMSEAYESVKRLSEELPNLLFNDDILEVTLTSMEMYMNGTIGKNVLGSYRKMCEDKYAFYDERENSNKLDIETKTNSLEMYALEILTKACSLKEFHEVPDLVEFLIEE